MIGIVVAEIEVVFSGAASQSVVLRNNIKVLGSIPVFAKLTCDLHILGKLIFAVNFLGSVWDSTLPKGTSLSRLIHCLADYDISPSKNDLFAKCQAQIALNTWEKSG